MKLIKLMKNKNLKIDIMTAFFNSLSEAAKKNRKIFFITADHGAWAIENLKNILKDRFINIGISEQNMVSVAAGLALQGKKVFIFSITPFVTQRCYEQIKMDICHSKLPVTIIGNGSSLTYAFHGTSHQAVEDIAIMRVLPNLNIFHPFDNLSAKQSVKYCLKSKTPNYVKLDKGFFPLIRKKSNNGFFNFVNNFKKKNILVITTGVITHDVQRLTSELKDKNIYLDILNMFILKPIKKKIFFKHNKEI